MTYEQITCETADGITTITLNRPDALNAFTHVMRDELIAAFDAADADDEVRAVIVTGAGRGFCAGADLSAGADTFNAGADDERAKARWAAGEIDGVPRDGGGTVALRIAESRKPVIVAFNGPAVGVGVTMMLPADIRLAAESARFGLVFARRGIVPEAASTWFLPRVVGISQAMEWVATGRIFDAREALSGRLVSHVVPDDDLLPAARGIAREIADNTSGISVAVSRQLLWGMLSADSPWEAHRLDSKAINGLGASPDAAEGVEAFLAKRQAKFPMRVSADYPDYIPPWPPRPTA
ncbi:Enoyl-CoA hydratase/carnithine racemase [Saccharopolyspora antimicrobica]|uniref:Enoyl-CoA hydratase/carnithine racemase n=1 Tax=Saccharopolyspora antimicrobica TaxID=455193 RepID=A0A1I4SBL6_9PSEU|nr:enoyl-CoA hydratase-related protein [Saccharopolyspora antimicrobica]RKT87672.1 enoyl-CoA hydratase/carnithine racemase [Saccharopolyspora antimicrobica]SFM61721.1 Enoyl-CoA hydratase/carnithine racemase [Saccharopolyspora antimicrobica]